MATNTPNPEEALKFERFMTQSILAKNRHSSLPPYQWYGPEPEIMPAGEDCGCGGCWARFYKPEGKT